MIHFFDKLPFATKPWFMYLRSLVRHFLDDNCTQKASSLTYTTLLSLVPIITVLLVIFSTTPALSDIKNQMLAALYSNLLPSSGIQVQVYLQSFADKAVNVTAIGVLMLFITTIMTLMTIETAFNQIWRIKDHPTNTNSIMRYWTIITLGPVILSVAFAASSMVQSLDFLNRKVAGYGIDWGIWAQIISFLVMMAGFIGMYWFIPRAKVPWRNAIIAGVVVAILFECVKRIFGVVIVNFTSYEAIYGAFAALPVFLLWIYVSWNLILLGVEISYTLTIFESKEVPVRHPLLSLLDMLNLIYKNYQKGVGTSEQALRDMLGRKELPKWQSYLYQLAHHNIIVKTENDDYTLKKDLSTINLWQFYKTLPYPLPIKDELDQLKSADYDPWFVELYDKLSKVEQSAKDSLNIPLSKLFDSAPLRQKQDTVRLVAQSEGVSDRLSNQGASFDSTANDAIDEAGNTILIPKGDSAFTESKWARWTRRVKKARHWFGRTKTAVKGVKQGLKNTPEDS